MRQPREQFALCLDNHKDLFAFVSFPESVETKLLAMETLRRPA